MSSKLGRKFYAEKDRFCSLSEWKSLLPASSHGLFPTTIPPLVTLRRDPQMIFRLLWSGGKTASNPGDFPILLKLSSKPLLLIFDFPSSSFCLFLGCQAEYCCLSPWVRRRQVSFDKEMCSDPFSVNVPSCQKDMIFSYPWLKEAWMLLWFVQYRHRIFSSCFALLRWSCIFPQCIVGFALPGWRVFGPLFSFWLGFCFIRVHLFMIWLAWNILWNKKKFWQMISFI